jgi:hypothetical protein
MDQRLISFFRLPGSKDRRCTRRALQRYLDEQGIHANIGTISQELMDARRRILGRQEISAYGIANLLQIAPPTVRTWMNGKMGLPFSKIPSQKRVLWLPLVCFLQDYHVPRELLYGYLEPDLERKDVTMKSPMIPSPDNGASEVPPHHPPQWYSPSEVLDLFAQHLCDGDRNHAQQKLNVLLETGGLTYEGTVAAPTHIDAKGVLAHLKKGHVNITRL